MRFNPDDAISDIFVAGILRIRTTIRQVNARRELCDELHVSHSINDEALALFAADQAKNNPQIGRLITDWTT